MCLFNKVLSSLASPLLRVAAGWTEGGESGLFADQLSKCTLWSLHKFPALCLGNTLHMSQPCSLWSLHHLFSNFQYIFYSSSKSCKELAAKLKQEGSSPADKEPILALITVEPQSVARLLEQLLSSAARGAARARMENSDVRPKWQDWGGQKEVLTPWPSKQASLHCLPHPGLQLPFARATGRRLWLP